MKKLYNSLLPALDVRVTSLHNEGYVCLTKKDIFNYLVKKWDKYTEISDMVDDIMNVDGLSISKTIENELFRRKS